MSRLTYFTNINGNDIVLVDNYSLEECLKHQKILSTLAAYEESGISSEQVMKLKEKQIPYKLEPCHPYEGKCKCGAMFLDKTTDYCGNCGQKLDWSN